MPWDTDDRRLYYQQRALDAQQAEAKRKIDEKKWRDAGLRTQAEERLAYEETRAWED